MFIFSQQSNVSMSAVVCAICRDGFSPTESLVNANGIHWHQKCFVCVQVISAPKYGQVRGNMLLPNMVKKMSFLSKYGLCFVHKTLELFIFSGKLVISLTPPPPLVPYSL